MAKPRFNLRADPRKALAYGISAKVHEGAAVVSGSRRIELERSVECESVQSLCEGALESLAAYVDKSNGLVGHIKAFVQAKNGAVTLSTTGGGIGVKASGEWQGHSSNEFEVSMAAIAFTGVAELEKRLISALDSLDGLSTLVDKD